MENEAVALKKLELLKSVIGHYQNVLLAYSGGVDSTLLLAVSAQVLGNRVTAVTVRHLAHTEKEILDAAELARNLGVRHYILDATASSKSIFQYNPVDRCYLCKRLIYEMLLVEARQHEIELVLDGSHSEDIEDDRPGLRALTELGIAMPLKQAGLRKSDIRLIARLLRLPNYNQPARPCLATRFAPGEAIDAGKLSMVIQAEDYLSSLGLRDFRVRYRGGEARIETTREGMISLLNMEVVDHLNRALSSLGFTGVFLDLRGYQGRI